VYEHGGGGGELTAAEMLMGLAWTAFLVWRRELCLVCPCRSGRKWWQKGCAGVGDAVVGYSATDRGSTSIRVLPTERVTAAAAVAAAAAAAALSAVIISLASVLEVVLWTGGVVWQLQHARASNSNVLLLALLCGLSPHTGD